VALVVDVPESEHFVIDKHKFSKRVHIKIAWL
jgi:hypothetical protein